MIFCDIDGTLLNSEHQVSPDTKRKIHELFAAGVPFILVSGRMPEGIGTVLDELEIQAPIVGYSGAIILDEKKQPIKSIGIPMPQALEIKRFIAERWSGVCVGSYYYDHWIVDDAQNPFVLEDVAIIKRQAVQGTLEKDFADYPEIHKFLCMADPSVIEEMERVMLQRYPSGYTIYRSNDKYLEIMNCEAMKSNAVKVLCERYGIAMEDTLSFGDNYNDIDMLNATGLGFAMGNAPSGVKSRVKYTTADNDHDGILKALKLVPF